MKSPRTIAGGQQAKNGNSRPDTSAASIRLSKSKFVAGVQCLKRLYLEVYHPELAGEVDEGQEARFEQGHEVGVLA